MLRTTHTTTVTEDQIDHLGHMNVRFYAQSARLGTNALVGDLVGWDTGSPELFDLYTRHLREQMLGSRLEVRSGVLGVDTDELVLHHELANVESGELAATFIHRLHPVDERGERVPLGAEAVAAASAQVIDIPAHAAPRTIVPEHDLATTAPDLSELQERRLATHHPRIVPTEDCDADGRMSTDALPMLIWGGERIEGAEPDLGDGTHEGRTLAWASMESRIRIARPARRGMRVQAFAAVIAVHDKVFHSVQWAHDLDSGDLLVAFETVSLAFDIGARRPASIPDEVRAHLLAGSQPDLAPAAAASA